MDAIDYLLDENGDLAFANGDLVIGFSDNQHIQDTINAFPGWWKQYHADGVGIAQYSKAHFPFQKVRSRIQLQLQLDGYLVRSVLFKTINGKINIYPDAIRQ